MQETRAFWERWGVRLMEIHLARNGQRFGPYPVEVLKAYLAEGKVTAEDLAWSPDRQAWVPLKVVLEGLAPSAGPLPDPEPEEAPASPASSAELFTAPADPGPRTVRTPRLRIPWSRRGALRTAAGALLLVALVIWAKLPDHASIASTEPFLRPDEGYAFVDPYDSWNWDVQWVPRTPSTTRAHLIAAPEPDTWIPAPGYSWPSTETASPEPAWVPLKREPEFPHVAAGYAPDTWIPDPGYVLTGSALSPNVGWRSGIQLQHMTSAEREGYWILEAGYSFAADSTVEQPKASWSPGARHPDYPHIFADTQERRWHVDPDYAWSSSEAGDLRTFSPGRTWQAWSVASDIDAATQGIDCSSEGAVLSVIESARDRYHALDTSDVHPSLARHFASTKEALSNGATTINTCLVVDNAGDTADIIAGGLCLFSDKSWDECMNDSKSARELIDLGGKLGSIPCGQALQGVGTRLDELASERQQLQQFLRAQYNLQLNSPVRLVSCR
jgi:hypothetical protein